MEERTCDAAQESKRQEDHYRAGGARGQRTKELACSLPDQCPVFALAGAQTSNDVLDHHYDIVDDEPDGGRHATERHDIEAHPEGVQKQNRCCQDRRHK